MPLALADADELLGVLSEPALYAFSVRVRPTLSQLRERLARQLRGISPDGREAWLNWTVRLRAEAKVIGRLQAGVRGSRAELAWLIAVAWQRQGYASEAARAVVAWLAEHEVKTCVAKIHPDNVASQIVASRTGLMPSRRLVDGEVVWSVRRGRGLTQ